MPSFLRPVLWLFSPLGVIIISGAGTGFAILFIKKITHNGESLVVVKIILCIIALITVFVFSVKLFMSDFNKPSLVDISPLEKMEAKSFYNMEEIQKRLEKLKNVAGVNEFEPPTLISTNPYGQIGFCGYNMKNQEIPASIIVLIAVYDSSENAQDYFKTASLEKEKKQEVKLSENIDAILFHSAMWRSADQFWSYDDNRYVNTYIRIGNIVINYMECEDELCEIGALTNRNIEMVCQVLIE